MLNLVWDLSEPVKKVTQLLDIWQVLGFVEVKREEGRRLKKNAPTPPLPHSPTLGLSHSSSPPRTIAIAC
ncbi:hypothetical protein QUB68_06810 [Microcoleus sp. A006_D1]|uniref:hypothetical protein n=1 Tax=Microcoleus sp. A006_D1 TaxID=3055267 RepID=UPI002FCF6F9E